MFELLAQVGIAFTGATAVFLTQCRPAWARYACWFGMAGEPFWFYTSIHKQQWGIFCLAFYYTFAWGKGIYMHWWLPYRAVRQATRHQECWCSKLYCPKQHEPIARSHRHDY